jgi:hypothetical protein
MLGVYAFGSLYIAAVIAAGAVGGASIDYLDTLAQGVAIGMLGRLISITSALDRRSRYGGE